MHWNDIAGFVCLFERREGGLYQHLWEKRKMLSQLSIFNKNAFGVTPGYNWIKTKVSTKIWDLCNVELDIQPWWFQVKPKYFSGIFLRKLDLKISSSMFIHLELLHNNDKKSKYYLFRILNNFYFIKFFIKPLLKGVN